MTQDTTLLPPEPLDIQAALDQGRSLQVIAWLEAEPPATAAAWRQLGQAYLRAGRTLDAELPLRRGLALGDPEAQLAYGNWLRVIGQFAGAVRELAQVIAASPPGERRGLAQLAQGAALLGLGDVQAALDSAHLAWDTYPDAAPPYRRARIARVLGQMHLHLGALGTARRLHELAMAELEHDPDPLARFLALRAQGRIQARSGQRQDAQVSFGAALELLRSGSEDSLRVQALRLGAEAELLAQVGDSGARSRERTALLRELRAQAGALHDAELRLFAVRELAEALSRRGQHAPAMHTLYDLGTARGLPPMLGVLRGVLMSRQRQYPQAIGDLEGAGRIREADPLLYWRSRLWLADAYYREARQTEGLELLTRTLSALAGLEDRRFFGPDWPELAELVQHALLEPDLAPLMESLLGDASSDGAGPASSVPEQPDLPRLELQVLGPGTATLDAEPCALSAGALLIVCSLHLSSGHSRNDLMAQLYPDFDRAETTAHFRLAVRELRAALGPDILLLDDTLRHPRYRLGPVQLNLDLTVLRAALAQSDLGAALEVYRGAFLDDLDPPSDWADWLRGELRMTLNLELQANLDAAQTAPALRQALKLTARFLDIDPAVGEAAPELEEARRAAYRRLGSIGQS